MLVILHTYLVHGVIVVGFGENIVQEAAAHTLSEPVRRQL